MCPWNSAPHRFEARQQYVYTGDGFAEALHCAVQRSMPHLGTARVGSVAGQSVGGCAQSGGSSFYYACMANTCKRLAVQLDVQQHGRMHHGCTAVDPMMHGTRDIQCCRAGRKMHAQRNLAALSKHNAEA